MYCEFHDNMRFHRKPSRLADGLGVPLAQACGHLALLWTWAIHNAPRGDLTDFEPREIARAACWDGDATLFLSALVGCELLDHHYDREQESLLIHDWQDYQGRMLERRDSDNARRKKNRTAEQVFSAAQAKVSSTNAAHTPTTIAEKRRLQLLACQPIYKAFPRHEERESALEEIRLALIRIKSGDDVPDDLGDLEEWPPIKPIDWLLARTVAYAQSPQGQRKQYVPYPERWYKRKRYLEPVATWENGGEYDGELHGAGRHAAAGRARSARFARAEQFVGGKSSKPIAAAPPSPNQGQRGELDMLWGLDGAPPGER